MFQYRYIDKIPAPRVGAGLIQGKAYHLAIAATLANKIEQGEPLSLEDTLGMYSQSFDQVKLQETVDKDSGLIFADIDWDGKNPGQWKDEGVDLVKAYYKNILLPRLIEPAAVERRLVVDVEGVKVVGYLDLELADAKVVEHKLVAKGWPQQDADRHLQPSFYAVLREQPTEFEFHLAVKAKDPRIDVVYTRRSEQQILWVRKRIVDTWQLIQTGIFPPNPTGYSCNPRYCSHTERCSFEPGKAVPVDEIAW